MGDIDIKANIEEVPAEFRQPEIFPVAPIENYGCFSEYLAEAEKVYDECEKAFLTGDVRSEGFVQLSDDFAEASKTLIMGAAALFVKSPVNIDNKLRAVTILDRCKKGAGIREKNIRLRYDLLKQEKPEEKTLLRNALRKVMKSLGFFFRAETTHMNYLRRYMNSSDYHTPEYRAEMERGERAQKKIEMTPPGHCFMPARPFPPVRIPEGMKVPWPPEPFVKWKNLPVEDFVYDSEHDEFVLPKGYVSADGRIDDQSVVWNWEENTVTCKFVGGEPVTWPFWKARKTSDVFKRDTWYGEYYQRLYAQWEHESHPPGYADDP